MEEKNTMEPQYLAAAGRAWKEPKTDPDLEWNHFQKVSLI